MTPITQDSAILTYDELQKIYHGSMAIAEHKADLACILSVDEIKTIESVYYLLGNFFMGGKS